MLLGYLKEYAGVFSESSVSTNSAASLSGRMYVSPVATYGLQYELRDAYALRATSRQRAVPSLMWSCGSTV
jgi:hypothetical protein